MSDLAGAAERLTAVEGGILLTTGSKELAPFAVPGLRERCFPRVLPSLDSLGRCLELGFSPAHVLCMQGPFSKELNLAIIRQYGIGALVTKASAGPAAFGTRRRPHGKLAAPSWWWRGPVRRQEGAWKS